MINAYILASGSKGNATLIFDGKTNILIDFGISKKSIDEKLVKFGKNFAEINYFLFTHAHSDHIKFYEDAPIEKRFSLEGVVELRKENILYLYETVTMGDFKVTPIRASHDANPTCGYLIENGEDDLVYLTDTGLIKKRVLNYIRNRKYYIIESNHDVEMLVNSGRPALLIQRILSQKGHLSNEDSAFYMTGLVGERTEKIILAHLSEECNTPEKALETYRKIFELKDIDFNKYDVRCAYQHEVVILWLRLK